MTANATADLLDETYVRLHQTGPEFDGWLSNHGPMAADALLRMGHGEDVTSWVTGYARRLEERPAGRDVLAESEWRANLGDFHRLGDWLALFDRLVDEEAWQDVLVRWWPRLLPGGAASATHGLIRTGHAVRALGERQTDARVRELGQALGYWAARWQLVPGERAPRGSLTVSAALDEVPATQSDGGFRERLAALAEVPRWSASLAALEPLARPEDVPAALEALTDTAIDRYARWAPGAPIMLVHAATAPRAALLALPALPVDLWTSTYAMAWTCSAAVVAAYRPDEGSAARVPASLTAEDLADRAARHGDEHVIKLVEVALESHRRGSERALEAGLRAMELVEAD
jgi:hypothetical protein